jgi:transposase InsO family protein
VEYDLLPFGSYRCLVSDQGREFCNTILDEVTKLLGINKLRTTAYRASANGRVERVHRTLNTLLSKFISENQRDWAERLLMVVAAYNAACHETTEYSPYYLMFGREYKTPLDLTLEILQQAVPQDLCDYTVQFARANSFGLFRCQQTFEHENSAHEKQIRRQSSLVTVNTR